MNVRITGRPAVMLAAAALAAAALVAAGPQAVAAPATPLSPLAPPAMAQSPPAMDPVWPGGRGTFRGSPQLLVAPRG